MTRSNRRLSTPTRHDCTAGSIRTSGGDPWPCPSMCPNPATTERCTSSDTLTSSRKTSTEPASARDISRRSPTMRWNRCRSSLRSWRARCGARRQVLAVALEDLEGGGQRGQGRPQLVAHVGIEPRLALDALLQLVDHRVEGDGEPLEVGVGGVGVEAGVQLSARDGARRPRHVGQRPEGPHAGEAPERDTQDGGHDAGTEEGEAEHAERVVEVGQVEHLEVDGVHGRDRARRPRSRPPPGPCGTSAWRRCRPGPLCAASGGWTRR